MNQLENFVLKKLSEYIFNADTIKRFIDNFPEISDKKVKKDKVKLRELKNSLRINARKIQNCVTQIENGCSKIVADKLGERIEMLETENRRIDKNIKRLHKDIMKLPTPCEIEALNNNFIHYMQSKNNLPIRKQFLQKVIESIKITDDMVEIIFNLSRFLNQLIICEFYE